ncbi:response regulator transcription factor [Amphritea sp. 2_MG-2023]|uniref:response regulator transcription factor n=1 Tax=Amphritea TaxID=515417 RepID=UPI0026E1C99F|nr:response regulator transcription factor [Amphritea sp. 2_MG-2023]MDO6418124.1 response regulator transcription factor [Amphritea sp. 2_MG-2023]MDX2422121.1 response regulator transcription factor [Amphritea sp.]
MSNHKIIYVIDDEKDICQLVSQELEQFGYHVRSFTTGAQACHAIRTRPPVLCIIDLGLPDMDGMELVKQLCELHSIGIMILSGRNSVPDKVLGLELGADDYIVKPFIPRELVARVNSLVRRITNTETQAKNETRTARFANLSYDPKTLSLTRTDGRQAELSSAEHELLIKLLKTPKTILSRDQLMGDSTGPFDRSIDVRMSRVRKKVEQDPKNPEIIKTIYGVGYILTTDVSWHN